MAKYRLFLTTQAKPDRAEAYSEWCRAQHFPDLLRVPGVVGAQRFKILTKEGEPETFLSVFDLDQEPKSVLAEMSRRNGTPEMPVGDFHDPASVKAQFAELEGEWTA